MYTKLTFNMNQGEKRHLNSISKLIAPIFPNCQSDKSDNWRRRDSTQVNEPSNKQLVINVDEITTHQSKEQISSSLTKKDKIQKLNQNLDFKISNQNPEKRLNDHPEKGINKTVKITLKKLMNEHTNPIESVNMDTKETPINQYLQDLQVKTNVKKEVADVLNSESRHNETRKDEASYSDHVNQFYSSPNDFSSDPQFRTFQYPPPHFMYPSFYPPFIQPIGHQTHLNPMLTSETISNNDITSPMFGMNGQPISNFNPLAYMYPPPQFYPHMQINEHGMPYTTPFQMPFPQIPRYSSDPTPSESIPSRQQQSNESEQLISKPLSIKPWMISTISPI